MDQKPQQAKPIYLLGSSPLVAGGKARLMSNRKVKPNRAKPREVSEIESHGYTDQIHKKAKQEPEPLDQADWDRHIGKEVDQRAKARELERERTARLLSIEERILQAQKDAAAKRRDVRREMWILRQMQERQRSPQLIEKRVQVLERIVYLGRAA